MGRSPFDTEHTTWIDSPELTGPSPNEKGTIFGSTEILLMINLKLFSFSIMSKFLRTNHHNNTHAHTYNEFFLSEVFILEIKHGKYEIETKL